MRPTLTVSAALFAASAVVGAACSDEKSSSSGTTNEGKDAATAEGAAEDADVPADVRADRPLAPEPDASYRKGMTVDGGANACGVCDRDWVCNDLQQPWRSEVDGGRCVNQKNGTALRCDGTLDGNATSDVGTWVGSDDQLTLNFAGLNPGEVHQVFCLPPHE